MLFQSGVVLPFFLIAIVLVLATVDLLGTSKSTSVMTERSTSPYLDRQYASGAPTVPARRAGV